MIKPLDSPHMMRTLQQLMRSDEIVPAELQRVAKAQIDMCLRCEVHNHVNLELAEAAQNIFTLSDIAVEEGKVRPPLEHAGVVA